MTEDVIKALQTKLAHDLVEFEHVADNQALSKSDLKLISEAYEKVYQTLHEIIITGSQ